MGIADRTDWRAANRADWDERTRLHLASGGYDLAALHSGQDRINAIEEAELGPVDGGCASTCSAISGATA